MDRFTKALRKSTERKFAHMGRTALYFKDPALEAITVHVIVTDRFQALGDLKGTNFNYAEVLDNTPRIEFLASEVQPSRNYFISIEPGVAYQIDTVQPPEDITVTANVIRLGPEKMKNFPFPVME